MITESEETVNKKDRFKLNREAVQKALRQPVFRAVISEAIPAELKAIPHWVVWKARMVGDKWTKPPTDAKTGRDASTKEPST